MAPEFEAETLALSEPMTISWAAVAIEVAVDGRSTAEVVCVAGPGVVGVAQAHGVRVLPDCEVQPGQACCLEGEQQVELAVAVDVAGRCEGLRAPAWRRWCRRGS